MNKKLIMISQVSAMVLANQGFAMSYTVKVDDVMNKEEKDGKVILKGINMNASQLKGKVSKGDTIELTIPGKIDGKQVELASEAFYDLNMNGAFLELKFGDSVKFPEDCSYMFAHGFNAAQSPITRIDFGKVDTSKVTNMEGMFYL